MIGGGGGITNWMIGEVATEDEDEEGLASAEEVVCGLAVGDRTSGVRGCKTIGSKMISCHKTIGFCSNQALFEKGVKVRVLKGNELPRKGKGLMKGSMTY
jgi:hypothetical protein